jgi:hypothetical protein
VVVLGRGLGVFHSQGFVECVVVHEGKQQAQIWRSSPARITPSGESLDMLCRATQGQDRNAGVQLRADQTDRHWSQGCRRLASLSASNGLSSSSLLRRNVVSSKLAHCRSVQAEN